MERSLQQALSELVSRKGKASAASALPSAGSPPARPVAGR
jgi:hypothetical protein